MLADSGPRGERVQDAKESLEARIREAALTGVAVVVPILVTLYVLSVAVSVTTDLLDPLVILLNELGMTPNASELVIDVVSGVVLLALIIFVGFLATFQSGEQFLEYFDKVLERIPGVGAVYKSFRQMSDVMLESDADNFQSVKLVEFPHQDAYTIGFSTTETPDPISNAAGYDEMQTLFLPLAPNPVMGGHLTHVPKDLVEDVDMTVEEGMRTVVTMGVAISAVDTDEEGISQRKLEQLGGQDMAEPQVGEESE